MKKTWFLKQMAFTNFSKIGGGQKFDKHGPWNDNMSILGGFSYGKCYYKHHYIVHTMLMGHFEASKI